MAYFQVCQRWYEVLTGGRFGLDNVVVLNLFESGVWTNNMRSGQSTELTDVTCDMGNKTIYLCWTYAWFGIKK